MGGQKTLKCVIVGDGAVGKTCLLISYATNEFPKTYVPTVFANYVVEVRVGDEDCIFELIDTAGQEDYDRLRPLSYSGTSVFLVCFSVTNPVSFENVKKKWIPEITQHCPDTPFILIGTQKDMERSVDPKSVVNAKTARRFAYKKGASAYVECSAKTGYCVKDVFNQAIWASMNPRSRRRSPILSKCAIM